MSEQVAIGKDDWKKRPVVDTGSELAVLISHRELDSLIGRLMQVFDLNGDVEQRNALKSETKQRCREWLDDQYSQAGYDKWTGLREGVVSATVKLND